MTEAEAKKKRKSRDAEKEDLFLLHRVERFNLLLLLLLTTSGWYLVDWSFARSVLAGGAVSGGSFFWMKRTVIGFIRHIAEQGEDAGEKGKSFATVFALKFYARLFVLAFLLLLFNILFSVNATGLVIGLSTIMVSVILVVLFQGRMIFQKNM